MLTVMLLYFRVMLSIISVLTCLVMYRLSFRFKGVFCLVAASSVDCLTRILMSLSVLAPNTLAYLMTLSALCQTLGLLLFLQALHDLYKRINPQ